MDAEGQTFEFKTQAASDSLYDLSSQLRKVEKLSTRGNSASLASGAAQLGSLAANTTTKVHSVLEWRNEELSHTETKHKADLHRELEQLLRRVKDVQAKVTQTLKQRQQQTIQKQESQNSQLGDSNKAIVSNESTPLLQMQMQQQVLDQLDQSEVDLHAALVEERDVEIAEIQRSAREINAIFQDLGVLVAEQGQQLDSVEDNIADLAQDTELAGQQLVRAENHQRSKGKWTCMFLLFLLFLTVIVAISVLS